MRELLEKLQGITSHPKGPVKTPAATWQKLLAPRSVEYDNLPELLRDYLETALFRDPLPLTFDLYSLRHVKALIKDEPFFGQALDGGWFLIGDRDGDCISVSLKHGGVAVIPGWSITENQFVREKRYKSLETFFRGQLKHERQAAENAAESDRINEAFAESTDPNAVDSSGFTQLMRSVDDVKAVRRALEAGANPNITAKHSKATALHRAVNRENAAVVKLLLAHGAKVDLANGSKVTPLFSAVRKGNLNLVRLLVEAGADVNKPATHGYTPLGDAVGRGQEAVVKCLLERGADPNLLSGGSPPLTHALHNAPALKLLLKHGANPNGVGDQRPLARLYYHPDANELLRILLKADGIELNDPRDELLHNGKTPKWMELLCKAGADPSLISHHGSAPLMTTLRVEAKSPKEHKQNRLACAKVLLKYGADPNQVGEKGWNTTALLVATQNGFYEGMELLLAHGADPRLAPNDQDAFQTAEQIKPKKLVNRAMKILRTSAA